MPFQNIKSSTSQSLHYETSGDGNKSVVASVDRPHPNDVLLGRGGRTNLHEGNIWFRNLIKRNRALYISCPKHTKITVAKAIVKAVQDRNPPGRYMEGDKATGGWKEVPYKRAVDKTSQALRERDPDPISENKESFAEARKVACHASNDNLDDLIKVLLENAAVEQSSSLQTEPVTKTTPKEKANVEKAALLDGDKQSSSLQAKPKVPPKKRKAPEKSEGSVSRLSILAAGLKDHVQQSPPIHTNQTTTGAPIEKRREPQGSRIPASQASILKAGPLDVSVKSSLTQAKPITNGAPTINRENGQDPQGRSFEADGATGERREIPNDRAVVTSSQTSREEGPNPTSENRELSSNSLEARASASATSRLDSLAKILLEDFRKSSVLPAEPRSTLARPPKKRKESSILTIV